MHFIQSEFPFRTIHFIILTIVINVFNACRKCVYCAQFTVHTLYSRNNKSRLLVCSSEHNQVIKQKVCENHLQSVTQTFYCPVTFDLVNQNSISLQLLNSFFPIYDSLPFSLWGCADLFLHWAVGLILEIQQLLHIRGIFSSLSTRLSEHTGE